MFTAANTSSILISKSIVSRHDFHIITFINFLFCFPVKIHGCEDLREISLLLWPETFKANHLNKILREDLDREFEVDLKSHSDIYQPRKK